MRRLLVVQVRGNLAFTCSSLLDIHSHRFTAIGGAKSRNRMERHRYWQARQNMGLDGPLWQNSWRCETRIVGHRYQCCFSAVEILLAGKSHRRVAGRLRRRCDRSRTT